jgi:GTP cyclohydrolase I
MQDTQGLSDSRGVYLDQVGVRDLHYPITIMDRLKSKQQTTACFNLAVSLPPEQRGTHMSRFVEVLEENRGEVTMHTLPGILARLCQRLEANDAKIEVEFPYFIERSAPATGAVGMMNYECSFTGTLGKESSCFKMSVRVPVTSLCPCSKAISDYGAHNQRGYISIEVEPSTSPTGSPEFIWFEELIELAERSASAPVYPLLKREDERFVTMQAYDNPVFVEDMVRNVAVELREDIRVSCFKIEAVNLESIHNHSAFAETTWIRPTTPD